MSYTHVFLHLAFLLLACVSAVISGNAGNEEMHRMKLKAFTYRSTVFAAHTREYPDGIPFSVDENCPYIKPKTDTKIIIHGQFHTNHIPDIIKAYVNSSSDLNVISFTWKFVWHLNYSYAARAAKYLGRVVLSNAIAKIGCQYNLQPHQIHLIGHNLGAHVAGIAGASLGPKVGRITGLDPSRKCFEIPCDGVNFTGLSRTNAIFVDVLHTNAFVEGYGNPIGTIDLYANGGVFQPACYHSTDRNCNAIMSIRYYADSIKTKTDYQAILCDTREKFLKNECKDFSKIIKWPEIEDIAALTPGNYYFETKAVPPYSKGKDGTIPAETRLK